MQTKHYKIENLEDFSESRDKLKKYLDDIERIFPVIERVFGGAWKEDYIYIVLEDSKKATYNRLGGRHTVYMGIYNDAIQTRDYPKNLWGCLLHETLHAFINPIIYKDGGINYLDGSCDHEPFVRSFQGLVYLNLKEDKVLSDDLCSKFLSRLRDELKEDEKKLYDEYFEFFSINHKRFKKFIQRLNLSKKPLIGKDTVFEDFRKLKEEIKSSLGS